MQDSINHLSYFHHETSIEREKERRAALDREEMSLLLSFDDRKFQFYVSFAILVFGNIHERQIFYGTPRENMNHNLLDFYSATYWPLEGKWDSFSWICKDVFARFAGRESRLDE